MDRILIVLAAVFFYSSSSLAADETQVYDDFLHTMVSYQDIGFDEAKPIIRADGYDRLFDQSVSIEDYSANEWFDNGAGNLEAGIGLGVAPFFGEYGVFRTSTNHEKPAYFVLGYISDELVSDETALPDDIDDRRFSIGFGVISESSFSFEYMMSVDETDYEVSTIGVGIISEF